MRPKVVIITVSLAFVLALSLLFIPEESRASSASYISSESTSGFGGGTSSFYYVEIMSDYDTFQAGCTVPLQGRVYSPTDDDIEGHYVSIIVKDPNGMDYLKGEDADSTGGFETAVDIRCDVSGNYTVTALADAIEENRASNTLEIMVVAPPPEEEKEEIPYVYFQLGALFAAFASMAVASTESAGFSLFNIFAFPLYSRLRKDEVLDHFVRGQIYGFIVSNPGEHYNSIREKLKVTNGTLSYHLRTLEVQGFIKSRKESIYRRFYPIEMKFPRDKGVKLSDLQLAMLDSMKQRPAPTQKDIASYLGISQQVASYNLKVLTRKGFVQVRKEGRKRMYYQADTKSPIGL
jgi:predicted transcriptional regulator